MQLNNELHVFQWLHGGMPLMAHVSESIQGKRMQLELWRMHLALGHVGLVMDAGITPYLEGW